MRGLVLAGLMLAAGPAPADEAALAPLIASCWNASAEAAGVAVTVSFAIDADGAVSVLPELVAVADAPPELQAAALRAARLAVMRCLNAPGPVAGPREIALTFGG